MAWHGDRVAERVHDAEAEGLAETGERIVDRARSDHPGWKSRTGEAERSIIHEDVRRDANGSRMRVGSRLGRFIFLEIGSRGRAGDHTLRRAKDVEAGHLAERIKAGISS